MTGGLSHLTGIDSTFADYNGDGVTDFVDGNSTTKVVSRLMGGPGVFDPAASSLTGPTDGGYQLTGYVVH